MYTYDPMSVLAQDKSPNILSQATRTLDSIDDSITQVSSIAFQLDKFLQAKEAEKTAKYMNALNYYTNLEQNAFNNKLNRAKAIDNANYRKANYDLALNAHKLAQDKFNTEKSQLDEEKGLQDIANQYNAAIIEARNRGDSKLANELIAEAYRNNVGKYVQKPSYTNEGIDYQALLSNAKTSDDIQKIRANLPNDKRSNFDEIVRAYKPDLYVDTKQTMKSQDDVVNGNIKGFEPTDDFIDGLDKLVNDSSELGQAFSHVPLLNHLSSSNKDRARTIVDTFKAKHINDKANGNILRDGTTYTQVMYNLLNNAVENETIFDTGWVNGSGFNDDVIKGIAKKLTGNEYLVGKDTSLKNVKKLRNNKSFYESLEEAFAAYLEMLETGEQPEMVIDAYSKDGKGKQVVMTPDEIRRAAELYSYINLVGSHTNKHK